MAMNTSPENIANDMHNAKLTLTILQVLYLWFEYTYIACATDKLAFSWY